MTISICTPVWGRPEMTRAFMQHMKRHQELVDFDLRVSVAGSEGFRSADLATEQGFDYVEHPNQPLGDKFNAAIRLALFLHEPDYICIMGSDTFMLPTIWDEVTRRIEAGEEYIGITDLFMWDWNTDEAVYWPGYHVSNPRRAGEPIGPMRVIHRNLIPEDGELYDPSLSSSLDASASRKLPQASTFESKPHLLVSCKEDISITPISKFNEAHLERADVNLMKATLTI